jgi:hypothetical protein
MTETGLRPCCVCEMQFEGFGHNPEPFDGDVGMCCTDCNERWVVPVRILFGRGGDGVPLPLFKRMAEMGAASVANAKTAREWAAKQRA